VIVDSSALLAILNRELDAVRYEEAILGTVPCRMSVANMLETSIVIESRGGAEAGQELDAYAEHARIEPAPVTTEHLEAARQARDKDHALRRRSGPGVMGDTPRPVQSPPDVSHEDISPMRSETTETAREAGSGAGRSRPGGII